MTLIEALKSGKKIRRHSREIWIDLNHFNVESWSTESVLANDWEIEPEEKKKVKRWLWMVQRKFKKDNFQIYHLLQDGVFYNDEEMQHFDWGEFPAPKFQKLLWSETEFEE